MEHIFEAFQNSFQPNEKAIFIANVKDEKNEDGDLMLTNNRLIFYPAKPKKIQDVLFINIELITEIKKNDKGLEISSGTNKSVYEMEILKDDFISKILDINTKIVIS